MRFFLLDIMDGLLDVDFTFKLLFLPVQGCDVAPAAAEKEKSAVAGVVEHVRAELRQAELEPLGSGFLVDALAKLSLAYSDENVKKTVSFFVIETADQYP
jgi:hypothetical protein